MAFTVEDGSRPAGANSYITVQFFRDHHTDRGRDALISDIADADVQSACIRATDYSDKRWGKRLRGVKSTSSQSLQWPRLSAFDNANHILNDVPLLQQKAVAEYAWIIANQEKDLAPPVGVPFATVDPETGEVTDASGVVSKSEQVGPIKETLRYGDTSSERRVPMTSSGNMIQNIPEYPEADLWMEELMRPRMSGRIARG